MQWSKIKHKKLANDAARGASYGSISREIIAAIKAHTSNAPAGQAADPQHNTRLGMLVKKAKDLGFPKDKIEASIAKASGKGADQLQTVTYEALGPTNENGSATALVIECSTDSPARTHSKIREAFNRLGGRLSSTAHLFDRVGLVRVACLGGERSFDEVFNQAVELDAEDVTLLDKEELSEGELEQLSSALDKAKGSDPPIIEIRCDPSSLKTIAEAMRSEGHEVLEAEPKLLPNGPVLYPSGEGSEEGGMAPSDRAELEQEETFGGWVDEEYVKRMDKLLGMLEDNADCTRLWSTLAGWPAR
jgi:transcriptional/translational regulatory protein YebC/TACO1